MGDLVKHGHALHALPLVDAAFSPARQPLLSGFTIDKGAEVARFSCESGMVAAMIEAVGAVAFLGLHG